MDRLWSPWRSNYIESFSKKNKDDECVFCKALTEDIQSDDSLVIYKGEKVFVMLNLFPYNNGHLMIIPYRHISDPLLLTEEETIEIMKLNKMIMAAITKVMNPQGFNFGANFGKAAGAGIHEHIHFHIVPRWMGDTNFMPALGEVKIISQDLLQTKKNLMEAISKFAENK